MSPLERRYRRLLRAYPRGYRAARADELVGTLLDLAGPGRTWPTPAEALDLTLGGLRERLRRPLLAGAEAGLAIAAPYALGLAGALALFAWLVIEPAPDGYATFGGYLTVAPVAYAAWLLALGVHSVRPGRWARRATVLATVVTVGLLPLSAVVSGARPPLWVLATLLCLGGLSLAGGADGRTGITERVAVPAGAALAAAVAKSLLLSWPPRLRPVAGYYQPSLYLVGLLFGAVVVGLGLAGLSTARRGEPGRPWLWAALLIALPGSWLGPGPQSGWPLVTTGLGFGRLAEVLTGSVVVLAAMTWLVPGRDRTARQPGQSQPGQGQHEQGQHEQGQHEQGRRGQGQHGQGWVGGGLGRAGATAVGVATGVSVVLAVLARVGTAQSTGRAAGMLLALGLTVLGGRATRTGGALVLVAATVAAAPGTPRTVTASLAVLGLIALAGAGHGRTSRGYPLLVAVLTALAAALLAVYDADWHWARPTPAYPALAVTLAVVPCALAAMAGLRELTSSRHRASAALALGCGLAWLATLALPSLPLWGPVLLAVPLGGTVIAARRLRART